jgi:hypothetical protein
VAKAVRVRVSPSAPITSPGCPEKSRKPVRLNVLRAFQFAPEWYLGGSLAAGFTNSHMNSGSSGSGKTYDGSITLKHIAGPWQFAGSFAVSHGDFDGDRNVSFGGVNQGLKSHPGGGWHTVCAASAQSRPGQRRGHADARVRTPCGSGCEDVAAGLRRLWREFSEHNNGLNGPNGVSITVDHQARRIAGC